MALAVCGACGELKGIVDRPRRPQAIGLTLQQACACEPPADERWRGYDFNLDGELCRACALTIVPSGLKWSTWLCTRCLPLARGVNELWGTCVVPIGRHSFVNGVSVRGGRHIDEHVIGEFTRQLGSLFERMDRLAEWRRLVVAANRSAAGLAIDGDVPAQRYLTSCAAAGLTSDARFGELLDSIGVPDR